MTYEPAGICLWLDLPTTLRYGDDQRPSLNMELPLPDERCHAGVVGDTGRARQRQQPKGVRYRCPMRWSNAGLCYVHHSRADDATRIRAAFLSVPKP